MARNNFQYEKRQRELEKKRKADDKAKRKLEPRADGDDSAEAAPDGDAAEPATDEQQANTAAPSNLA